MSTRVFSVNTKDRLKKLGFLVANIVVLTIFVTKFFADLSVDKMLEGWKYIDVKTTFLVLLINVILLLLYSTRLKHILGCNLKTATGVAVTGLAYNNLLPYRLGDAIRLGFGKGYFDIPVEKGLISILIEKGLDLFCLGALFLVTICLAPDLWQFLFPSQKNLGVAVPVILVISVTILLLFCSYIVFKDKYLPKIKRFADASYFDFKNLRSKKMEVGLTTFAIWLLTILSVDIYFSYYIEEFSILDTLLLTILSSLSISISVVPLNLGAFELTIASYINQMHDVEINLAIVLAFNFHLLIMSIFVISVPLVYLFKNK
jgi:uncharacterized membrane protein YbhN (UPF0104 family)